MILAAGLGTRLKPWTDTHPKALAVVRGKTLLERQIRYLQKYGIFEVVLNVHHFASQIIQAVEENDGWGSTVFISNEVEEALETGGGLKYASHLLQDSNPVVLMNVDILTDLDLSEMIRFHQAKKGVATLAVSDRTTSRYFLFDNDNRLCGWTNAKTGVKRIAREVSPLVRKAFSGIHIIDRKLFSLLPAEAKFSMVDVYLEIAGSHPVYGFDHSGGVFLDVGKPETLELAQQMAEEL